ncbi:MAG: Ig domain-containing protein, partial [Candidatus Ornithomonoglobus sp.]
MPIKRWTAAVCAAAVLLSGTAFAAPEGAEQTEIQEEEMEVFAASFDGGRGTEEDPYLISNEAQLTLVADLPQKCFKLINDIELGNDWIPLGLYGEAFGGIFDGCGFTVSNMVVSDGSGFFNNVAGTVKNLNVKGEVNSTNQYTGGIAAHSSGTLENCSFSGTVKSSYENLYDSWYIGGLIGDNSGMVSGCSTNGTVSAGDVKAENAYVGGLIGYSNGAVSNSYSDCSVTKEGYRGKAAGGLVGYMEGGSIRSSYATGNVEPYTNKGTTYKFQYGGGLIGYINNWSEGIIIENCYAAGSSEADSYAGGLIGYTDGWSINIKNCYSLGKPNASTTGGLLGFYGYDRPIITSCYYDSQTSGCTDSENGSPKTTSGMKNQIIYENWDFENIWGIDESEAINSGYPYLLWELEKKGSVSKITLDQTSAEIQMGSSFTLVPTAEGENTEGISYTWTSSDKTIATVDNGTVTGQNFGNAVITVSYGSVSASCKVTVLDNRIKVTSVTLDKSDAGIVVNETVQLTASVLPEDA